jgi:ElaB/YqjD/DUF883 family membrane-anchored ribosome-binding protein
MGGRAKRRRNKEPLREKAMFHRRSSEFEPRISAITEHLRAIQKELGVIGKSAGQRTSAGASAALDQIADAIRPVLQEIESRFREGQHAAANQAAELGREALKIGSEARSQALDRISEQAEEHPLATIGVALGVGFLIGVAVCRS